MLAKVKKATGGNAQRTRFKKGTESPPTLMELGLDKKTSMVAQQEAGMPDDVREDNCQPRENVQRAAAETATGEGARNCPFITRLMNCFYLRILPRYP
jgi:hypothetical protein